MVFIFLVLAQIVNGHKLWYPVAVYYLYGAVSLRLQAPMETKKQAVKACFLLK